MPPQRHGRDGRPSSSASAVDDDREGEERPGHPARSHGPGPDATRAVRLRPIPPGRTTELAHAERLRTKAVHQTPCAPHNFTRCRERLRSSSSCTARSGPVRETSSRSHSTNVCHDRNRLLRCVCVGARALPQDCIVTSIVYSICDRREKEKRTRSLTPILVWLIQN